MQHTICEIVRLRRILAMRLVEHRVIMRHARVLKEMVHSKGVTVLIKTNAGMITPAQVYAKTQQRFLASQHQLSIARRNLAQHNVKKAPALCYYLAAYVSAAQPVALLLGFSRKGGTC